MLLSAGSQPEAVASGRIRHTPGQVVSGLGSVAICTVHSQIKLKNNRLM